MGQGLLPARHIVAIVSKPSFLISVDRDYLAPGAMPRSLQILPTVDGLKPLSAAIVL